VGKNKFTNILIKGESVSTGTEGHNEEGGRGVEAVGGSDKVGSRLKGVGKALSFLFGTFFSDTFWVNFTVFIVFVDSNDGSGWDTGVNVGGSIERVKDGNVLASFLNDEFRLIIVDISYKINLFLYFDKE
jgi:hypothetical protein